MVRVNLGQFAVGLFGGAALLAAVGAPAQAAVLAGTTAHVAITEDNYGPVALYDGSYNPVPSGDYSVPSSGGVVVETYRDFGLTISDTSVVAGDILGYPQDGFTVSISGLPHNLSFTPDAGNSLSSSYSGGTFSFYEPYGSPTSESWTVSLAGGVPEPATWGVMLLGIAGVGAMLRQRRGMISQAA